MILVVTNTEDITSDFIIREIRRRGVPFFRLNTDEFPQHLIGVVSFRSESKSHLLLKRQSPKLELDFSSVTSILFRRPVAPVPHSEIVDGGIRKFCTDECNDFLHGLWLIPRCYWMSHPNAIRTASYKMVQLNIAKELFNVPETLITNDSKEAREFLLSRQRRVIIKPLRSGRVVENGATRFLYATEIAMSDQHSMNDLCFAPSILQERVEKEFDVRVTIVGDTVFAARIYAANLPSTVPDWRFAGEESLRYGHEQLPESVADACVRLVRQLGLEFGAIDLAVDANGQYWFFEVNPNGQWAWLEMELGLPISSAIVDCLVSPPTRT